MENQWLKKSLIPPAKKGTGKWTAVSALDLGIPLTLIGESVFARCLSAQKDMRVEASKVLSGPVVDKTIDKAQMISDLKDALFGAKIISYAQGYNLMMEAAKEYGLEPQLWRHRPDVARWLYHPFGILSRH